MNGKKCPISVQVWSVNLNPAFLIVLSEFDIPVKAIVDYFSVTEG